jgi:hypothetical protein
MVIDVSYNYATTTNYSGLDQFNFVAAGTTPPTTNSADTFLGQPCVSATFPVLAGGGFAVSRAQSTPGDAVQAVTRGGAYIFAFEYAISRPLVSGESLQAYLTGVFGTQAISLNSSVAPGVWHKSGQLWGVNTVSNGSVYPVVFSSTVSGSPLTVYMRQVSSKTILGNHLYQSTAAACPLYMESAGKRFIRFDGVDDVLFAAFTINQAIDRISGINQTAWSVDDRIFNGFTAAAALLCQLPSSPQLQLWSGLNSGPVVGMPLGIPAVVTERYNGASSSAAINNSNYAVGNAGTDIPGGVAVGASVFGSQAAQFDWYGSIMRGGVAAMSDAEIALCRLWCATRAGVTL